MKQEYTEPLLNVMFTETLDIIRTSEIELPKDEF